MLPTNLVYKQNLISSPAGWMWHSKDDIISRLY